MSDALKITMLETEIESLNSALLYKASKTTQVMDMILVALDEGDIDEARSILKSAMGYEDEEPD